MNTVKDFVTDYGMAIAVKDFVIDYGMAIAVTAFGIYIINGEPLIKAFSI